MMDSDSFPMQKIIDEIAAALKADLRYAAVYMALGIPDALAALTDPKFNTDGHKYAKWWEEFVADRYRMIDGSHLAGYDVYALRNTAYHHSALIQHEKRPWKRIIFSWAEGTVHKYISGNDEAHKILTLDPRIFCKDICEGASAWAAKNHNDPNVKANWPKLWRYRPNGIAGEAGILGMPLIG